MNGRRSTWLVRLCCLLVAAAALAGCAATRLASSWRDPDDRGAPLRKVAVFVLAKDDNTRRFAEDQAVRALPRGSAGVASYTLFDQPNVGEERVRARLTQDGFDAALVSRLVAHERNQTYVSPQTHILPLAPPPLVPYYGSFYRYYPWVVQTYTTPGYTTETEYVVIETLVYRLPEGRPVWSGVTETVNPDSSLELVQELVRILRAELQKTGLLPPG